MPDPVAALGTAFDQAVALRRAEADEFYAELTPAAATAAYSAEVAEFIATA